MKYDFLLVTLESLKSAKAESPGISRRRYTTKYPQSNCIYAKWLKITEIIALWTAKQSINQSKYFIVVQVIQITSGTTVGEVRSISPV